MCVCRADVLERGFRMVRVFGFLSVAVLAFALAFGVSGCSNGPTGGDKVGDTKMKDDKMKDRKMSGDKMNDTSTALASFS